MKNNLIQKTVGKWKIWTAVASALLVVGILIAAIFGFNGTVDFKSAKTLTVKCGFVADVEDLKDVCEESFQESGLTPTKVVTATGGDQIIYYFAKDVELTAAADALKTKVESANVASMVSVDVHGESFLQGLAEGYVLRAAIAVGVFAVLAFAYVALRYRLSMGIVMAAAMLSSVGGTMAIVACTRIPTSASFVYAVAFSVLLTVVMTLLTFHRLRDNAKDKSDKDMSVEEKTVKAVNLKGVSALAITFTVAAALLVLIPGGRWFALSVWVAVLAATFSSLIFAPSLFVALDPVIKKSDKPLFTFKKKEKAQKASKETLVEEAVVEPAVEETAVEPVAEEVAEEVTEEQE